MIYLGENKYKTYIGDVQFKFQDKLISGSIPDIYVQCDWIASAKNSYIDTGIKPNPNYSIEVVAKIYKYADAGYYTLFGTRNGNNARFTMRDNNNSTVTSFQRSISSTTSYANYNHSINRSDRANAWYTYGLYKNLAKINGTVVNTFDESTSTTAFPYTLYLSALNNNGSSAADYGYYYFKSCKIWDDSDTLIRDYIPVYNILNGKFGFYDKIGKSFSSSGTSNEFIGNLRNSQLPTGYTELDYVRFNGTQSIRFDETIYTTDCFEIEWKLNELTKQQRILYAGNAFSQYANSTPYNCFTYGSTTERSTATKLDYGRSHLIFDGLNQNYSIDAHATDKTFSLSTYTTEGNNGYFLIGSNLGTQYATMDLYCLKKKVNGVLKRNLIPCVNSNDIYGLYDIIANEFRTPTNGTFLSGGYIRD